MSCVPLHENFPSNEVVTEVESTDKYGAALGPKSSAYEEQADAGISLSPIFSVNAKKPNLCSLDRLPSSRRLMRN